MICDFLALNSSAVMSPASNIFFSFASRSTGSSVPADGADGAGCAGCIGWAGKPCWAGAPSCCCTCPDCGAPRSEADGVGECSYCGHVFVAALATEYARDRQEHP